MEADNIGDDVDVDDVVQDMVTVAMEVRQLASLLCCLPFTLSGCTVFIMPAFITH